jgi:hypothetical protein
MLLKFKAFKCDFQYTVNTERGENKRKQCGLSYCYFCRAKFSFLKITYPGCPYYMQGPANA